MSRTRSTGWVLAALLAAVGVLLGLTVRQDRPPAIGLAPLTAYGEGVSSPVASPHVMPTPLYPLPSAADLTSANAMTAGGATMIQAAAAMEQAAQTMIAAADPAVVDLGEHWLQDAQTLRDHGAWMMLSETAGSMVHDPDKAHELDLYSLRGNGMSMAAEGQAMADHGREMLAEVAQLRQDGMIAADVADELTTAAQQLVTAGEALARDGERMQDYADKMLQSLGLGQ
jgi:hypothetical protein